MILRPRISGGKRFKRRWETFAAILGIALGYPLFLITLLIPNYTTDIVFDALTVGIPDLLGNINQILSIIPYLLKGVFASINDVDVSNPFYPLTFFFISFIEFPSCLGWIVPGILIGYYRNKQFFNVDIKNNGWKVFWHGALFIQISILILAGGFILTYILQFIPGLGTNEITLSLFGSGIMKLLLFFISPFFWIACLSAGLGGRIGSTLARNKAVKSEVVVEEVEPEKIFEEEGELIEKEMKKVVESEEELWPEDAEKQEAYDIAEVDVASLKHKIKASASEAEQSQEDTIKCPKCGKVLPTGAKFCNQCGQKLKS